MIPSTGDSLRRWILGFCIIRFDLELGQTVEECFPPDAFTLEQQLLIAFSSFPDSTRHQHRLRSSSSISDSIFSFRFPFNSSFAYAFVFNRQRSDDRLPRGGDQRSVVILSHLPLPCVFRPLLHILAPLCFDLGPSRALPLVSHHISLWPPPPPPSSVVDLPIASSSLRARIPQTPFHDSPLFPPFRGLLLHLWTLWELVLVGAEPLLLIAPTPTLCSDAVLALVSLVSPLVPSHDFRPYFTIHDTDFPRLASGSASAAPPMLLGVTNLLFLKSLPNIPHIVFIGTTTTTTPPPTRSFLSAVRMMKKEGPLSLMTRHREAVWSSYVPVVKPDTAVLNRLVDAGAEQQRIDQESMAVVNTDILRRHFVELTTNFLAPFGPYLRGTTPVEGSGSPFALEESALMPFRMEEFLGGLAERGPGKFLAKRMKSNWLDLYRYEFTKESVIEAIGGC